MYRHGMTTSGLLREQTYYLLAALLEEPLHGYAIAARVKDLTDGRLRLAAGTLYGALDRLLDRELVRVDREEVVAGRDRKLYALTDRGEALLVENARRFHAAARVVTTRRTVPLTEGAS